MMSRKKALLLWAFLGVVAQASGAEDFVSLQYDYFNFTNSKQKDYGNRATVHAKVSHEYKSLQLVYEKTITETYKPPMTTNLNVDKVMLRYDQKVFKKGKYDLGLIAVRDNIVPTDGGRVFYGGYYHQLTPLVALDGHFYYGHYSIMKTYQFDAALKLHKKFGEVDTRLVGVVKDIVVDECSDVFCANAEPNYLTAGLKAKLDYEGYFLHGATFYGKRVFAVMMEGFQLQHHAMEFDRTNMVGAGKRFGDIELKVRYIYQRAKELPLNNSGVTINAVSLRVKYLY
jgi:hypothetical protein